MSFIFLLLILALFVIILIPAFLFSAIRTILSMLGFLFTGKRHRSSSSSRSSSYGGGTGSFYGQASAGGNAKPHSSAQRKKLFDKDEGEYVDFEEIKEDK